MNLCAWGMLIAIMGWNETAAVGLWMIWNKGTRGSVVLLIGLAQFKHSKFEPQSCDCLLVKSSNIALNQKNSLNRTLEGEQPRAPKTIIMIAVTPNI